MALTAEFQVALFEGRFPIVDADGRPTIEFLRALNAFVRVVNTQGDYLEAINSANAAAANANAAAGAAQSETSIVNSFVKDFVGASPLEVDAAGNVTIKNHTRQYGDQMLNPDVAITGAILATGATAGQIVRVYYDDPTRSDTTPTFAFSIDPVTPPIQGGDRHVIGAVEIPGAGTSNGGYVRPPGYTNPIP